MIVRALLKALCALAALGSAAFAQDGPRHAIAMYGVPALEPGFTALPYANPDAPPGGEMILAEVGGFDSLNPFILAGRAPGHMRPLMYESLMGRNWDEPFTLYGLLAESVETPPDRSWVSFTLRPEARFSDGSPVTVEDVIWSFEVLGAQGHPRYRTAWGKVAGIRKTGPRSLRIDFAEADRELPLIMGLRPVMKRAGWEARDFSRSGPEAPVGSGPYVLGDVQMGRAIGFRRDPAWWGRDLPFNRGQHNLQTIRVEYFGDAAAAFEAFKGGAVTFWREGSAQRWLTAYDFPAVAEGRIVKAEIPHGRPTGMSGLAMNTRRAHLADWRVREALIAAFNFEFIAGAVTGGLSPRIASYFGNSELGMRPGPAEGLVRELLAPFAASLPPGALEGYALPVSDGTARNRAGLGRAQALLAEAGWQVRDGALRDSGGREFALEVLLRTGDREMAAIVEMYQPALARLGIALRVVRVDDAQYRARVDAYDFDMTPFSRFVSLSPGNEQRLYWGSVGVAQPGSRNLMGMASPAAEAMIDRMLAAQDRETHVAAVRALDRVLMAGRYAVPLWYDPVSRIAHDRRLAHPARLPVYGDWSGFVPDVWWYAPGAEG